MAAKRLIVLASIISGITFLLMVFVFTTLSAQNKQPVLRALIGMDVGIFALWIITGGLLMWAYRDFIRTIIVKSPIDWRITFVLFCTLLAMLEEAVTTLMTNLAPLFGVRIGQVYITASANYWDVIWGHSVIILIPTFIAWAFILNRWNFRPRESLLLYGLTGTIIETAFGSPPGLIGMWLFVYGLMVYLPAYCIPQERGATAPRFWSYVLSIALPLIFIPIFYPFVLLIHRYWPSTATTFPPIILKNN